MRDISGLASSLNGYLKWNKARTACFLKLLLGLFAVKTVNLKEIALSMGGKACVASRYRRLQRFFALFQIDFTQIARWIFSLYAMKGEDFYLVIDRTNWYCGKKKINIFMLGIAHEGMAIPLFWEMLPKAGNSNFKEQRKLILRFLMTFKTSGLKGILADREFASGKFFCWLNKKKLPFYIRIKEGSTVEIKDKKFHKAKKTFFTFKSERTRYFFDERYVIWGECISCRFSLRDRRINDCCNQSICQKRHCYLPAALGNRISFSGA